MAPSSKDAAGDAASATLAAQAQAIAQTAAEIAGNQDEHVHEDAAPGAPQTRPSDAEDDDANAAAPPAYGGRLGSVSNEDASLGLGTNASVGHDGRVNININQRSQRLSTLLAPALRSQLELAADLPCPPPYPLHPESQVTPADLPAWLKLGEPEEGVPPRLMIAIHVVGSRGDVQPFVALGKYLQSTFRHRIRIATHPNFKDFVEENGLEFFSIGGDPAELMAFMVKNPGLMPGFDTLRSGDVGKRRKEIGQMIKGCWRSCIETGNGMGAEASDKSDESWMQYDTSTANFHDIASKYKVQDRPFVADAIIANPPSFAHIHCAEKLGCPLHIMFTMPYSPTQAFPHPLANIQSSNADTHLTNFMSYAMVDMMTWQGLGDVVNRFRQHSLGLEPISLMWAPGMLSRLRVPHTYCWSPALIPKPKDWANYISISGFYFLSLASNYTPAADLQAFLDAGPPPVYIGFGSIVVDDPTAMTKMIFDAVRMTGQRALVSKGWGGIGADELGIPDNVFMLGNVPHDWLFNHVSCVVHHGGAGTTAAGIACGKPTVVVPFFGDQPFWGAMVARAGAGPEPIAYKNLDADKLAKQIDTALEPASLDRAKDLAASISHEHGCAAGAQSFHQFLELDKMRCVLAPRRVAVWRVKRTQVRLSALAATVLGNAGLLDYKDLKLFRAREYETEDGPWDPITGGATAIVGTISSMMMGVADFPVETLKALKIHPQSTKKKAEKEPSDNDRISQRTQTASTGAMSARGRSSRQSSLESLESATTSCALTPESRSTSPSQFNLTESLSRIASSVSTSSTIGPESGSSALRPIGSLGQALRQQLGDELRKRTTRSRSCSSSTRQGRSGSFGEKSDALLTAMETGTGVSRIVGAGFKSPMDFTHGLAKGFHNAPKLYGDETVRQSDKITDFKSGVVAATREFGYGFYDGITGLVTQPLEGAQKEGAAGFFKGFAKGIGGVVLKPGAAIFGIPAYTMKGVYKELQAKLGSSVQNYIIASRTAQGYTHWHFSEPEEREEIIRKWKDMQSQLQKKRNPDEIVRDWTMDLHAQRREWQAEQKAKLLDHTKNISLGRVSTPKKDKRLSDDRSAAPPLRHADTARAKPLSPLSPDRTGRKRAGTTSALLAHFHNRYRDEGAPLATASTSTDATSPMASPAEAAELEAAIRASVADTSKGNAEQDAAIERAIRASINELMSEPAGALTSDADALHQGYDTPVEMLGMEDEVDHEHDEESMAIERAMAASMADTHRHGDNTRDNGADDDVDDEELQRALKESLRVHGFEGNMAREGGDEKRAAGKGRAAGVVGDPEKSAEELKRQRTEEEIVLEYVKKQSLAEAEHRKAMLGKRSGGGSGA